MSASTSNATSPLDRLRSGIRTFHSNVYPDRAEAYRKAASEPQKPHTLVITCSDSRIDPEAITSSGPGEIFVTRNIGNMVPAYGDAHGGVSAVIEYAVAALKVRHVAVCGHTDCGAMKALLNPAAAESLPAVKNWLINGRAALAVTETLADGKDQKELLPTVTEQNVLLQLAQLRTHPVVAGAMARGELTVSGWVYDIAAGDVRILDDATGTFQSCTADTSTVQAPAK